MKLVHLLCFAASLLFSVAAQAQTRTTMAVAGKALAIAEYREGLKLYKEGKITESLPHIKLSLEQGATAEGYYLQAMCYKKLAKEALAMESFATVLTLNPDHVEALSQLGILEFNVAKYGLAAEHLAKAYTLKPSDSQLKEFADKAKIASAKGSSKSAPATAAAPSMLDKVAKAAGASISSATATTGATSSATAATTSSSHVKLYNEGLQFLKESDYYSAITAFNKALKESPNHAATYYNLGLAYRELKGEESNAIRTITKAVNLDRKNAKYQYALGVIYYDMGEGDKAQENFEGAYSLGMRTKGLYKSLASTYFFNSKYDKAILLYETAVAEDPKDVQMLYNLGTAYLNGNKLSAAITTFEKVVRMDAKYKDAYYNMACALIKVEKYEESIKIGEQLIKIDPDFAKGYLALASAYSKMGDSYHQDKYAKMAKKLDPTIKI